VKHEEFVQMIEDYYGDYPEERSSAKGVVLQYVRKTYTGAALDPLFGRLILEVSGRFRQPPDVAVIEQVRRQMLQDPEPSWRGRAAGDADTEEITDAERSDVARKLRVFLDQLSTRLRADRREEAAVEKP